MTSGPMEGDNFRAGSRIPAGAVSGEGDVPAGNWRDFSRCRETDPEVFFPEKGGSVKPAKQICGSCPVQYECLEFAVAQGFEHGMWGGLSEIERRRMRRAA